MKKGGLIVDIGTGDGSFVYRLAKQHPDRLVIGINPDAKTVRRVSSKLDKKPARGGIKNVLFVLASIGELPDELANVANQVFINFPWGNLLKGIVNVEHATWSNIRKICKAGALVDIVFGYEEQREPTVTRQLALPYIDEAHRKWMRAELRREDFELLKFVKVSSAVLKRFPSSWAKRLAYGKERTYFYLRLRAT